MRKISAIFGFAAAFAMISCGGGGGELDGADGSMDATTFDAVKSSLPFTKLLDASKLSNGSVSPPQGLPTFVSFAPTPYDPCTKTTGNLTDADGDNISVSKQTTMTCDQVSDGSGGKLTRKGTYLEKDLDDTKAGVQGGYSFDYDVYDIYDAAHEYNESSYSGFWRADVTSSTLTMSSGYSVTNKNIPHNAGFAESDFTYQTQFTQKYTPTSINTIWQAGTMTWDGYLKFSGKIANHNLSHDVAVTFKMEGKATYASGCPTYFKDGTLKYSDAGGNYVEYTWVNCSETKTMNGKVF